MIWFWTIAGLLTLGGLLAVTPAFLRRSTQALGDNREQNIAIARERLRDLDVQLSEGVIDQSTFEQEKDDLEKGLLEDIGTEEGISVDSGTGQGKLALVLTGVLVPALAIGLYYKLGSPQHMDVKGGTQVTESPHSEAPTADELIVRLEERTRENPQDPDGWFMLGRMYSTTGRFGDAVRAYEKLVEAIDQAEISNISPDQDGTLLGEVQKTIKLLKYSINCYMDDIFSLQACRKNDIDADAIA